MAEDQPGNRGERNRRGFIVRAFTWLGLTSLATSLVSTAYANFRFFFPKVLYEPPSQFKAGYPGDYQPGTVSDRWLKEHQVFMVREVIAGPPPEDVIYALSAVCTHLGCLTRYWPAEELFKCPCHGSNFSVQGDVVAGPAPVPLYRLALSLGDDGQIVVDKARQEDDPRKRTQKLFLLKV
jgi:cytochrome b6-f complex iron-sulfur subunit